jgi:FecR protein
MYLPRFCRTAVVAPAAAMVALLAIAASATAQPAPDRIGVTGAVNASTTGQPPGQTQRTLLIGSDVVYDETIRTQADGQAQILFLDKSAFSIGPGTEVVIDRFVYDRDRGTGELLASAGKGLFRFVGGALSKGPDAVKIKTPTATIGVRGGVALVDIAASSTTVVFLYGAAVTVQGSSGASQRLIRPSYAVTVTPDGKVSEPFPVSPASLQALLARLDGRPGGDGGAAEVPTGMTIVESGYPVVNSQDIRQANNDVGRLRRVRVPPPTDLASRPELDEIHTATIASATMELSPATPVDPFADLRAYLLASGVIDSAGLIPTDALTAVEQMPRAGRATYLGSYAAALDKSGARSIVTGNFRQNWNFGTASGSVVLQNLAGGNIIGSVSTGSGAPLNSFSGTLSGTGLTGTIRGNFYDLFTLQAGQTAGTFNFSGSGVIGTGNFRALSPAS